MATLTSNATRIGRLDRRITIQQRSGARDALNQPLDVWVDVLTVWASINPLSGRELFAAEAVQSEVTHEITIRWRSEFADVRGLTKKRIAFGTRIFDIRSAINPDEQNVQIIIQAAEGLKPG